MKKFILGIIAVFALVSCSTPNRQTLKENMLTVVGEEVYSRNADMDLSIYTLRYDNAIPKGCGSQTTIVRLIGTKDAFEVGDKVKIVKIEK
jgi:hypothetical protein